VVIPAFRNRERRRTSVDSVARDGRVPFVHDPLKDTAVDLVQSHREVEPNLLRVYFYRDPAGREVRLVEIVEGSPSAEEVLPFRFAPDESRGVRYPVVIVELSPEEFDRVERGALPLPAGWTDREELYAA
jgi:hypothetical protein